MRLPEQVGLIGGREPGRELVRLFTSHEARLRAFVTSLIADRQLRRRRRCAAAGQSALWKKFDDFQPGTNFSDWAGPVVYLHAQQHRWGQAIYSVLSRVRKVLFDCVTQRVVAKVRRGT